MTTPARTAAPDASNGFDVVADAYIAGRGGGGFSPGAAVVRAWAEGLPRGAAVLDLGCGPGAPITQALADDGLRVHGVDADGRGVPGALPGRAGRVRERPGVPVL